jgi:hypothetical protein
MRAMTKILESDLYFGDNVDINEGRGVRSVC